MQAASNSHAGVTHFDGGAFSVASVTAGAVNGPLEASANAAANSGGRLHYTSNGTTGHGAVFDSISAIHVTQSATNLILTDSTMNLTGPADIPGLLRNSSLETLQIGGRIGDNAKVSIEVAAGDFESRKTTVDVAAQEINGASLTIDGETIARVTGAATTQIGPDGSVLVKTSGVLNLNAVALTFDGLAGGGTGLLRGWRAGCEWLLTREGHLAGRRLAGHPHSYHNAPWRRARKGQAGGTQVSCGFLASLRVDLSSLYQTVCFGCGQVFHVTISLAFRTH